MPRRSAPSRAPVTQPELRGLMRLTRETVSVAGLAMVMIVYGVQAFRIPSGSMEDSLLIGDQLLALKPAYGSPVLPFTYAKFPGLKDPSAGDVVIFRAPNNSGKDFIKRCVAGPGQTVEVRGRTVTVDDREASLPRSGKYIADGKQPVDGIGHFARLRIPARGDTIRTDGLPAREALFLKHLIRQEHPRARVRLDLQLYVDGVFADEERISSGTRDGQGFTVRDVNSGGAIDRIDQWPELDGAMRELRTLAASSFPGHEIEVRPAILLRGKPVSTYVVRNDNYFMMGDNRDNSLDSRYWGCVNRNHIKAQAMIIYFSLDPNVPLWALPMKIRWNRIGKVIRSWDGAA